MHYFVLHLEKHTKISNLDSEEALSSLKTNRILLPILIGLGVVFYLVYQQFDLNEFQKIKWNNYTLFLLCLTVFIYVLRHLAFAWRLRLLSGYKFKWSKSIELIFIWEFASAVSPTSLGGSAVGIFLLAQEKLSGAKAVSMVIITVIVDTLFFLISIPILYLFLGDESIRPLTDSTEMMVGFKWTLFSLWIFMFFYGFFFVLGILRSEFMSKFIRWISNISILKRYKPNLENIAKDFKTTSLEMRTKNSWFYIKIVFSSFVGWIFKFLAIALIILAIVHAVEPTFLNISVLYSRSEMMHTITQFSPTPGASGVSEWLFGGFYGDFIPKGIATIVAVIWRLITYYTYLIIGVIIIPNWIRTVWSRRKTQTEI